MHQKSLWQSFQRCTLQPAGHSLQMLCVTNLLSILAPKALLWLLWLLLLLLHLQHFPLLVKIVEMIHDICSFTTNCTLNIVITNTNATSPRVLWKCWPPMRKTERRNIVFLVLLSHISIHSSCLLMVFLAMKVMLWFVSWLSNMPWNWETCPVVCAFKHVQSHLSIAMLVPLTAVLDASIFLPAVSVLLILMARWLGAGLSQHPQLLSPFSSVLPPCFSFPFLPPFYFPSFPLLSAFCCTLTPSLLQLSCQLWFAWWLA